MGTPHLRHPGDGWHRPHRWAPDQMPRPPAAGLAVLVAAVQVVGTTMAARGQTPQRSLDLLGYALLAVGALALAGRRTAPVPVLVVATATTVGYTVAGYPGGPTFVALIIAIMAAVKAGQRHPAWVVAGAGYLAYTVLAWPGVRQAVVLLAWLLGVLLLAEAGRVRRQQLAQLAQVQAEQARARTEQARARAEQERRQASEERLRIAQELHDVLGHHLSLINVQAGVGLHLMDGQPDQARAALTTIRQASAEALREVRSVLAALYPADREAPRTPAAGLDRLAELTDGAGVPVRTSVLGTPRQLPAEVDRAAYRIVREALTNVRRHAAAGAAVTIVIEYAPGAVILRVDDDGAGGGPPAAAAEGEGGVAREAPVEGSGIAGMRERAAALGGSLTAGPRPGGGFRVHAELPLTQPHPQPQPQPQSQPQPPPHPQPPSQPSPAPERGPR